MNKYKIKSFKSEEIINADIVDILETGHIAFYKYIEGTDECELVAAFPSDFSFIKLATPDKMTPKEVEKVIDKIPDYIAKTKAPESVGLNFTEETTYDEGKANDDLQEQFKKHKKEKVVRLPDVPISNSMNEAQEQSETKHYRRMHSALDKFREEELKKTLDAKLKFANDARTEDLFNQQKLNDDIDTLINKEVPQPEAPEHNGGIDEVILVDADHVVYTGLSENVTADFNKLPETVLAELHDKAVNERAVEIMNEPVETKGSVTDKELQEVRDEWVLEDEEEEN